VGPVLAVTPAGATPFVPRQKLTELPGEPARLPARTSQATANDLAATLARLIEFQKRMQFSTACAAGPSCSFGGQIEVETGPGALIIESDNTQEAIWDFSFARQRMATGVDDKIANAFSYLAQFPGTDEWKDDPQAQGPDYYSVYNCGWGLRAVLEYELATGDLGHRAYGEACARHIGLYAQVPAGGGLIDAATSAWAAGGLWAWAQARGDAALRVRAAAIGAAAKAWLEAAPTRASMRTWATSGGAVFAGVVDSYLREHPEERLAWVERFAGQLGGWVDETQPLSLNDWTDWRNAHAAWNMLAQLEAAEVLGPGPGDGARMVGQDIYDRLIAQDTDMDGGIPGSERRPATEDQSWITSFVAYFGLRPLLAMAAQPSTPDGGAPATGGSSLMPRMDSGGCSLARGEAPGCGLLLLVMVLAASRRRA
jgi:hypothetical protein